MQLGESMQYEIKHNATKSEKEIELKHIDGLL